MKTQVVTVSSRNPTETYYKFSAFLESLRRLNVEPVVLGFGGEWSGLMTKPFLTRDWLRGDAAKTEFVIVCDSWDVIFQEHPDSIVERYQQLFPSLPVVFNAERGCWPRADLADKFPETTDPWRFLNSGFMIGRPEQILAILDHMQINEIGVDRVNPDGSRWEPNDQGYFQQAFIDQPVPMALDTRAELCLSCHGLQVEELQFSESQKKIKNTITGTFPGVFHCNGSGKNDVMPTIMQVMGLS